MKKFLLLLLVCGAAWFFWPKMQPLLGAKPEVKESASGTAPASGAQPKREAAPVPVVIGVVQQKDIPLFLNGIGTVQGFNTVTVRSRVDGQIDKVLFTEGQDVKAGDVLARLDPRPFQAALDQALAKKIQDEAFLSNARRDLQRDLTLLKEKAGTAQKADTQQALVSQLEAGIKADEAAVRAANVQLEYTTLRSPIDGRTGIRIVDEGNVVRSGDAGGLVVVTQLRPVSVVFTVSEQHLPAIQAQMANGKLPVITLARDNTTHTADGVLSVVDNQIDTTTGTIRLKATFPNVDLALWPGQFVNVRLRLSIAVGALVVPSAVVQRGPVGAYVFLIRSDDTVEVRLVKVAQAEDGNSIIEEGLKQGDRVVVDGQYRLQPGSRIKLVDKGDAKSSPKH